MAVRLATWATRKTVREARYDVDDVARQVSVGGHRLAIEVDGAGTPPLVCISALGFGRRQWDHVRVELGIATTVVTYDRPGMGASDPIPDDQPARRTFGWAADQLHSLLHAARVPSPRVLVGHSIGGLILERYVQHWP